jgi:hypothetical protein
MNLLSEYKPEITNAMKNIFDSFKRSEPIIFYKPNDEEIVILDSQFNADLQEYDAVNSNLVEKSQSFQCRLFFPKRESTFYTSIPNTSVPVKAEQDFAEISIQMEEDAYQYIKDAIRFTFAGENYQKMAPIRKLGFLDTFQLYQIYLKKVN